MNPTQLEALKHPVSSEEDLKKVWNQPRQFKITGFSRHVALVTTFVVKESGVYRWNSAVRVLLVTKNKLKRSELILPQERLILMAFLVNELAGVGKPERTTFNSTYAIHLEAEVTGDELGESLGEDIVGNGHKKPIKDPLAAMAILDRLEERAGCGTCGHSVIDHGIPEKGTRCFKEGCPCQRYKG